MCSLRVPALDILGSHWLQPSSYVMSQLFGFNSVQLQYFFFLVIQRVPTIGLPKKGEKQTIFDGVGLFPVLPFLFLTCCCYSSSTYRHLSLSNRTKGPTF